MQSKQVAVDLVGKLKFMNKFIVKIIEAGKEARPDNDESHMKFIVKIIEAGKEVAQSAGNTPKSQENKGIF